MGQTGSFAKVIEPLTFLLVQHDVNINISCPQSLTSDLILFVLKSISTAVGKFPLCGIWVLGQQP